MGVHTYFIVYTHPKRQKYRIVKELVDDGKPDSKPIYSYTIREVYYLENGKPHVCSEETFPYGNSRAELQENLLQMINALIYPALNEDCEDVDIEL